MMYLCTFQIYSFSLHKKYILGYMFRIAWSCVSWLQDYITNIRHKNSSSLQKLLLFVYFLQSVINSSADSIASSDWPFYHYFHLRRRLSRIYIKGYKDTKPFEIQDTSWRHNWNNGWSSKIDRIPKVKI